MIRDDSIAPAGVPVLDTGTALHALAERSDAATPPVSRGTVRLTRAEQGGGNVRGNGHVKAFVVGSLLLGHLVVGIATPPPVAAIASEDVIVGPLGSRCFGHGVYPLPSGNIVITDPCRGGDSGAVYLYHGRTRAVISELIGTSLDDRVGESVTVLANGNFVVESPGWSRPGWPSGAVTWGSGVTGVSGVVSATNSLVGAAWADSGAVWALPNGNYLVTSPLWSDGAVDDRMGAVTFANGTTGITGVVSPTNSLVGTRRGQRVGDKVTVLLNGNYVVGGGTVTWGSGTRGVVGPISSANSLVSADPSQPPVGGLVVPLANGNYVAVSYQRLGPFPGIVQGGPAVWGSGMTATIGVVSTANSLVGDVRAIVPLANGHYVAVTTNSVTWGDGYTGTTGLIGPANSLTTGSSTTFYPTVVPLTNGNYVVTSSDQQTSLSTWVNGSASISGQISPANSLVGFAGSQPASVTALANGNYVVINQQWSPGGGLTSVGAATWGNGVSGTVGVVSAANSVVGVASGDGVDMSVTALTNGNYVVSMPGWDAGSAGDVGAAAWGAGGTPSAGEMSATNGLVGSSASDGVDMTVTALSNGNYLVARQSWSNGSTPTVGALTWGDGGVGVTGPVSPTNSMVGSTSGDRFGRTVLALPGGGAAILSPNVDRPSLRNAGAVTRVGGMAPLSGTLDATNSLFGPGGYSPVRLVYEPVNELILVVYAGGDRVGIIAPPAFVPVQPARLLDTRSAPAGATVDGLFSGVGLFDGVRVVELPVAGRGGVPSDAEAVALNVTMTEPRAAGFVTVYPCGGALPNASTVNVSEANTSVANSAIAQLGTAGRVCVYASSITHLLVDVTGYFSAASGFRTAAPARVLESRAGQSHGTIDGRSQAFGPLTAGSVTELQLIGRAGIPSEARAVSLNVTVTDPKVAGFVTVYPCGDRPTASNVNYRPGQTIAAHVLASLSAAGRVCIFTLAETQVVVDAGGWFDGAGITPVVPSRLLETRSGAAGGTVDDGFEGVGVVAAGSTFVLPVAGRGPMGSARAVALTVTVTQPRADGFVTVFPCGSPRPNASNVNYRAGETIANTAIVRLGSGGNVCLYSLAETHLVVDATGAWR